MISNRRNYFVLIVGFNLVSVLACRPVITVGWGEILILVAVLALVVGPLLLRLFRSRSDKDGENKNRE